MRDRNCQWLPHHFCVSVRPGAKMRGGRQHTWGTRRYGNAVGGASRLAARLGDIWMRRAVSMEVRRRQMLRQLGEAETTHMLSSLTAIAMVVALREAAPLAGSLTQTRF